MKKNAIGIFWVIAIAAAIASIFYVTYILGFDIWSRILAQFFE